MKSLCCSKWIYKSIEKDMGKASEVPSFDYDFTTVVVPATWIKKCNTPIFWEENSAVGISINIWLLCIIQFLSVYPCGFFTSFVLPWSLRYQHSGGRLFMKLCIAAVWLYYLFWLALFALLNVRTHIKMCEDLKQ